MRTLCSVAITDTIRHSLAGAYQNTLGSRNSGEPMSITGLPAYWSRSARRPWSTRGTAPGCRHDRSGHVGAGVHRHHRRVLRRAEPGLFVVSTTTEPEKTPSLASKGMATGCCVPVHEVLARGMAPGHVAPDVPERVVLEEQVVDALVVDEPVRVVHPVLGRAEVVGGPVLRRVVGRRGRRAHAQGGEHGDDEQDDAATASRTRTSAG